MPEADTLREFARRPAALVRVGGAIRALRRADSEEERARARTALAATLADARGLPMKVGQFLGTLPGDAAFAPLSEGVDPLPWQRIRPVLADGLGAKLNRHFERIEEIGQAASLGQVHRALLRDGTVAAVKLQYPGIGGAVSLEMGLAGLLPGAGPVRRWGFDLSGYKQLFKQNLQRELDYAEEAARQSRFRASVQLTSVVIPEVFSDLCCKTVLTQRWEESQPLSAARAWSSRDRRHLADALVGLFMASVFRTGMLHADPHGGNWRCRMMRPGQPELVLYDFGCVLELTRRQRDGLRRMAEAAPGCTPAEALEAMAEAGFDAEKLGAMQHLLPALLALLFEPLMSPGAYDARCWKLGARIDTLLGDHKWWFRSAGPPELLLLMRAAHGVLVHLSTLDTDADWAAAGRAAELRLRTRSVELPKEAPVAARSNAAAEFLRVRVMEQGLQRIAVSMPAEQVARLGELMPDEVLARTRAMGLNPESIGQAAAASGCLPQELFSLELAGRSYRVWLE